MYTLKSSVVPYFLNMDPLVWNTTMELFIACPTQNLPEGWRVHAGIVAAPGSDTY